jgi:hypothetical protein
MVVVWGNLHNEGVFSSRRYGPGGLWALVYRHRSMTGWPNRQPRHLWREVPHSYQTFNISCLWRFFDIRRRSKIVSETRIGCSALIILFIGYLVWLTSLWIYHRSISRKPKSIINGHWQGYPLSAVANALTVSSFHESWSLWRCGGGAVWYSQVVQSRWPNQWSLIRLLSGMWIFSIMDLLGFLQIFICDLISFWNLLFPEFFIKA